MSRELLILRHGKSDWDAGFDDFLRPLKKRGKRAAKRMGEWLSQQRLIPELILTSPATRALSTAKKSAKEMELPKRSIIQDERIYLAEPETLLQVLAQCPPEAKRIMLVGHNPGLEELLEYLSDKAVKIPADGKLLPTATLAHLRFAEPWSELSQGCAQLVQIVRPADITPD